MNAKEVVLKRIRKKGPITFKEFMEITLYHSKSGYYSTQVVFNEDYITSARFDIFAKSISVAFQDMLEKCGGDTIVEFGAGDGSLARKILKRMDAKYIIVEKSYKMRERAKKNLKGFNVKFVDEKDIKNVNGIIFTNEFFDALPVNVIFNEGGVIKEVYVDYKDGRFIEVLKEPSTPELEEYIRNENIHLDEGYRAEINLDAVHYIQKFGNMLEKGFIFTIDYGFPSEEFYTPERRDGTVVCYDHYTYNYNPYMRLGKQDITSHVNFSSLMDYGRKVGLELTGFTNHLYFMMSTLSGSEIENFDSAEDFKYVAFRMGTFKILIQHKGIKKPYLKCLEMTPSFGFWSNYNYQGQQDFDLMDY